MLGVAAGALKANAKCLGCNVQMQIQIPDAPLIQVPGLPPGVPMNRHQRRAAAKNGSRLLGHNRKPL